MEEQNDLEWKYGQSKLTNIFKRIREGIQGIADLEVVLHREQQLQDKKRRRGAKNRRKKRRL